MKTIIAGSRGITDHQEMYYLMSQIWPDTINITEVISGTAAGVDTWGESWAKGFGIPVKSFPADWDKYGKAAGYIRNDEMAKYADACIIFWDGHSKGTQHMINLSTKYNLVLFVFTIKGNI